MPKQGKKRTWTFRAFSERGSEPSLLRDAIDGLLLLRTPQEGVVFTGRLGGVSKRPFQSLNLGKFTADDPRNVTENRRRVCRVLGIPDRWAIAKQVHGDRVSEAAASHIPTADGLWTDRSGLPLAVVAADCLTVALVGRRRVAAIHAGWRGIIGGVLQAGAATVGEGGRAWIGPSIGPCHYEVGDEVAAEFRRRFPSAVSSRNGQIFVDLREAARTALSAEGVVIADTEEPPCTHCDPDFFSERRDQRTGRHALVLWKP